MLLIAGLLSLFCINVELKLNRVELNKCDQFLYLVLLKLARRTALQPKSSDHPLNCEVMSPPPQDC